MIQTVRRAKAFYRCALCWKTINVGDLYSRTSFPPGTVGLDTKNKKWLYQKECRRCRKIVK